MDYTRYLPTSNPCSVSTPSKIEATEARTNGNRDDADDRLPTYCCTDNFIVAHELLVKDEPMVSDEMARDDPQTSMTSHLASQANLPARPLEAESEALIFDGRLSTNICNGNETLKNELLIKDEPMVSDEDEEMIYDDPCLSAIKTESISSDCVGAGRKLHFCMFCRRLQSNVGRHLIKVHKNEDSLRELVDLPSSHPKRKEVLARIRGHGDYLYNIDNPEVMIVARRSSKAENIEKDFAVCPNCRNTYVKKNLYRHFQKCGKLEGKRGFAVKLSQKLKFSTTNNNSLHQQFVDKIIQPMRNQEYGELVMKDEILQKFGMEQMERFFTSNSQHLSGSIRQQLNTICHIFTEFKNDVPVSEITELFNPSYYDGFLIAVKRVSGWNDETIRAPSTVTQAGNLYLKLSNMVVIQQLMSGKPTVAVDEWMRIHSSTFSFDVGYTSRKTRAKKRWEKPRWLPLTEDLSKFFTYTQELVEEALERLKIGYSEDHFEQLSKAIMVKILSFNRKRVANIDKMQLADFERRCKVNEQSKTWNWFDESEKILARRFYHIEIRGKLGKGVPVLLDNEDVEAITILLRFRKEARVSDDNKYLFARDEEFFIGSKAVHEFAEKCGAVEPQNITRTDLRKHLASTFQALAMNDNEISTLSDFLGDSQKTHNQFHCLPDVLQHTAKISRLLIQLNDGTVGALKGMNLLDIPVDGFIDGLTEEEESYPSAPSTSSVFQQPGQTGSSVTHQGKRVRWTEPQYNAIISHFGQHVFTTREKKLPSSHEIKGLQSKYKCFENRNTGQIKSFISNVRLNKIKRTPTGVLRRKRRKIGTTSSDVPNSDYTIPVKHAHHGKKFRWTAPQYNAIISHFGQQVFTTEEKKLPSTQEILDLQSRYKCFENRNTGQIKSFISNVRLDKIKRIPTGVHF